MHNKLLSPFAFIYYVRGLIYMVPLSFLIASGIHVSSTIMLVLLLSLSFGSDILSYFYFRYSILDDQIVIRKGIFVKKTIHIPFSRIQSIQHSQLFLLKPFNIESIKIETAGKKSEDGNELTAVNVQVGEYLEQKHREFVHPTVDEAVVEEKQQQAEATTSSDNSYIAGIKDIVLFSFTNLKLLYLFVFLLSRLGGDFFSSAIDDAANKLSQMSVAVIIASVITGILLAQTLVVVYNIIRYFDFTLSKKDKYLEIEMGLLSRSKIRVSTNRIQSVLVEQNLLQKWIHISTVRIVLATDESSKDDNGKELAIALPNLFAKDFAKRFKEYFGWVPLQYVATFKPTIRAWWIFSRNVSWIVLIPIILMWFFDNKVKIVLALIALLLLLIIIGNAHFKYVSTEVSLSGDDKDASMMISTSRLLNKRQYHIGWHQIQAMRIRQSIWMKKTQLAHIEVIIRSGMTGKTITAKYLPFNDAQKVYDWYRQ